MLAKWLVYMTAEGACALIQRSVAHAQEVVMKSSSELLMLCCINSVNVLCAYTNLLKLAIACYSDFAFEKPVIDVINCECLRLQCRDLAFRDHRQSLLD